MSILLASGTSYLPHVVGGLEVNTHELALELNRRGVKTSVLSRLPLRRVDGALRAAANFLRGTDVCVDRQFGYDVYRSRKPWDSLDGLPLPRLVVVVSDVRAGVNRSHAKPARDLVCPLLLGR